MKLKGIHGEWRSSSEWAKLLGVETELILICANAGKSIGDICALLKKVPPEPEEKKRKPRESAVMVKTKERMAILLEMSDIADREDAIKAIEVKRVDTHTSHGVYYEGLLLGVYNYRNGDLKLSGGQGVNLWKLEWEDAKVVQSPTGKWHLHPDTRGLVASTFKPDNGPEVDQLGAAIFKNELGKTGATPKTYSGFGKDLTCAQWARLLDVPISSLWRALQCGETVEEFATRRGIKVNRTPKKEQ